MIVSPARPHAFPPLLRDGCSASLTILYRLSLYGATTACLQHIELAANIDRAVNGDHSTHCAAR
jgi:hypothetical protein